ncbi:HAMP domain-containing sensor histidine kinase [Undibacterium sp. TJN19]|uniref:sensor histidine kinase n=1 Tax=Undibacterium sp. TJN19 TaxID=3413055 RepID=UPI003BF2C269
MKLRALQWKNWDLRSRLFLIILLPVVFMFCSIVWYSYHSRFEEAKGELRERAYVISTALAESVAYNLHTRNMPGLKNTMTDVMQSDRNIHKIDILDADKKNLVYIITVDTDGLLEPYVEVPVKNQMVWINLPKEPESAKSGIWSLDKPQGADNMVEKNAGIAGYVRVTMSTTRMLDKQSQRFLFELAISAVALFVSAVLAVYLALSLTRPLQTSIETLREIRNGDYSTTLEVSTGGEIGDLQTSINAMSVSLQQAKQDLENKVQDRTRDLVASRNEALKANAEKRKLIQKVHSIVEDERKSIAIEIHDELNASLIAARLEAQRIQHLASQAEASSVNTEIQERARAIIKLTLDLYANGRNLVRRLRPEVLDMLGLPGAVEDMLRNYNTNSDCRFQFDSDGDFSDIDSGLAISAYRIMQEALSNIVKHAQAHNVHVSLTRIEGGRQGNAPEDKQENKQDEKRLVIEVRDDGQGFDPDLTTAGIGLTGMKERVAAYNGTLLVASVVQNTAPSDADGDLPSTGTVITISLPLLLDHAASISTTQSLEPAG